MLGHAVDVRIQVLYGRGSEWALFNIEDGGMHGPIFVQKVNQLLEFFFFFFLIDNQLWELLDRPSPRFLTSNLWNFPTSQVALEIIEPNL